MIEKNALCLSQSAFSNFAPHVIRLATNGACYCLGKGTPERLEHYTRNVCNCFSFFGGGEVYLAKRNYGCYSAHVLYEKGHSGQIHSLNWKLQWHLHDAKSWRQISPILGFYFYLCHYRRRLNQLYWKKKKKKKSVLSRLSFYFQVNQTYEEVKEPKYSSV